MPGSRETVCSLQQQILLGENLFLHLQGWFNETPAYEVRDAKGKGMHLLYVFLDNEIYFTTQEALLISFSK